MTWIALVDADMLVTMRTVVGRSRSAAGPVFCKYQEPARLSWPVAPLADGSAPGAGERNLRRLASRRATGSTLHTSNAMTTKPRFTLRNTLHALAIVLACGCASGINPAHEQCHDNQAAFHPAQ